MNWRIARWWTAANAAGALVAMSILEIDYQSRVRAHDYNPHPRGYAIYFLAWIAGLIIMGALHAMACCWLDSLLKITNRALHLTIALTIAIAMAIVIPFAAALITYALEPFLAVWIFLPTAIFFGVLLGIRRAELPRAPAATR